MADAVVFKNVTKAYPGFVLDGVSFSMKEGRIVGLLGVNGAGKSTLLKCAMQFVHPDAGEVILSSHGGLLSRRDVCRVVGFVPESPTFYEWMTVGRLIRFVSSFFPSWDDSCGADLLRRYRLDVDAPIKTLSHGMRAKLSLLIAMSHRPDVLFLDEPTSGLDPVMRAGLLTEMRRLVDDRQVRAILFSSHVLAEVAEVASDIVVLRGGKLVYSTATRDLMSGWGKMVFTLSDEAAASAAFGDRYRSLGDGRAAIIIEIGKTESAVKQLQLLGATDIAIEHADAQEILLAMMQDGGGMC